MRKAECHALGLVVGRGGEEAGLAIEADTARTILS